MKRMQRIEPEDFESLSSEEKLLYAAYRSIMEKGYQATTSRTIAELAGVNQGLIHHYFGSHENLFARMIYWLHAQGHRVVERAGSRREVLRIFCQVGAKSGNFEADICGMARDMPQVRKALLDTLECKKKDIAEAFEFVDPNDVTIFMGALRGVQMEMALHEETDLENCLNRLGDLLLGGASKLDEPIHWTTKNRCIANDRELQKKVAKSR
ncbi:MAG: helix-turn-helix transcriptional regulator [Leptospiraceae bacterium]|nr:helix-turn-helix transcriptional regulator [Leptospiraceae bacterium]